MSKNRIRPHLARVLVAGLAALAIAGGLLEHPAHSPGATGGGSPSSNIAVIPGFAPKPYRGNSGVPPLPVSGTGVAKYHFTQLPIASVTAAELQKYDTVILYGTLWSDIPSAGQVAIDNFAAKHKVVIWDSDGTGAQSYSSFVHPFSTLSSGQGFEGKPSDSVVYFPTGVDFLASSNTASRYYLDPIQLVHDKDELNDMNAMKSGTSNWRPALLAANHGIPAGAWPIAWSYGVIGDHTGMTIYSGLDADAFPTQEKVNNDRKELALDLAAPFRSTPDSCAPGCKLPSAGPSHVFAACNFAKVGRHWKHGRVPVVLQTSLAAGITATIVNQSRRVLAKGSERAGELVPLVIPTNRLPANRSSRLRALVFVNGQKACTNRFQLIKAKARPRLMLLATSNGQRKQLTLRVNATSSMKVVARHLHWRTNRIFAHKVRQFSIPGSVRKARLILRDRAGHTLTRKLAWG